MYGPTLIRTEIGRFSVRIDEKLELVLKKDVFLYGLVSVSPREFAGARGAIAGIPLSPGFRRTGGAPTSLPARRGGPCTALLSRSYAARRPLFRFRPLPYRSKLLTALAENEISIAFAMLTP